MARSTTDLTKAIDFLRADVGNNRLLICVGNDQFTIQGLADQLNNGWPTPLISFKPENPEQALEKLGRMSPPQGMYALYGDRPIALQELVWQIADSLALPVATGAVAGRYMSREDHFVRGVAVEVRIHRREQILYICRVD